VGIPESQLTTWSNQGATVTAKSTHEAVRSALARTATALAGKDYDVYLQGSYKNDTNIRGDSDVDVVVQLNSTFIPDLSSLSEQDKAAYERAKNPATYQWIDFRRDMLTTLRSAFGSDVADAPKCIKIKGNGGRLPADVVPCFEYRHFLHFRSWQDSACLPGIVFFTQPDNRRIVNYPKVHYENGCSKNSQTTTNGWFKPSVRMVKNVRGLLVERGAVGPRDAPSYFVECLVYNAPNATFGGTFAQTLYKFLTWGSQVSLSTLRCQNGVTPLFGNTETQWQEASARSLLREMTLLWNAW
jgi:hypothetical protein